MTNWKRSPNMVIANLHDNLNTEGFLLTEDRMMYYSWVFNEDGSVTQRQVYYPYTDIYMNYVPKEFITF